VAVILRTHVSASAAPRRPILAVSAALAALSAYFGAVGLATGILKLDDNRLNSRLPFDSPVFGGVALACVVAVPLSVLASDAWRGDRRTDVVAVIAGVLLIGWIVVELAFLREVSFFHPTYAAIGAGFVASGLRSRRSRRSRR
jgi:uncharacterized protein involved in response to NO